MAGFVVVIPGVGNHLGVRKKQEKLPFLRMGARGMAWLSEWEQGDGKGELPAGECCKSSLLDRESDSSCGLRPGDVVRAGHGATAPPDKCSPSLRATPESPGCLILPGSCFSCRELSSRGIFVPGKGKGWECCCRANQSPQSLPHPCFSLFLGRAFSLGQSVQGFCAWDVSPWD